MSASTFFWSHNLPLIYFSYGLAFFALGLAIALQARARSDLRLSRSLHLLAWFGFTHAFVEFGHLFLPLQVVYLAPEQVVLLRLLHAFLTAVSFLFLFSFGVRLAVLTFPKYSRLQWLPVLFFFSWLVGVNPISAFSLTLSEASAWWRAADIYARYFLALPGALWSAYALAQQRQEIESLGSSRMMRYLRGAAGAFLLYAFFAGVVVPRGEILLSPWINETWFAAAVGLPVQIFRGGASLAIAYCIVRLLEVFTLECRRKLAQMENQRAVLEERMRISRDIHDGVLQSIYGVGLQLEGALYLEENPEVKKVLSRCVEMLNSTIGEIRSYITGLTLPAPGEKVRERFQELAKDLQARFGGQVNVRVDERVDAAVTQEEAEQIYFVAREAANNAVKHACAQRVEIRLGVQEGCLRLEVVDDGVGFVPAQVEGKNPGRCGLRNMRERARAIGARLEVESAPNQGTRVCLYLARGGRVDEEDPVAACR